MSTKEINLEFAKRLSKVSLSPTVALNSKANQLIKQGKDIINFSVGEPDYPTPLPIIEEAISSLRKFNTHYGSAGGGEALRAGIAAKLQRENGLNFQKEEIVCGIGAKEILFHLFLALLNEGDEVVFNAPFWVSYSDQVHLAGGTTKVIPFPDTFTRPMYTANNLEGWVTDKTKVFLLCAPNNPVGYCLTEEELKNLGNFLKKKNCWIISDEIYEYMTFSGKHLSLLNVCPELRDRFILVNGFSKGFAMTGWRVGYAAAPKALASLVRNIQSHSSTCLPPFIEEAATFAISQGKALVTKELAQLKSRRDLAVECLAKIPEISYVPPDGAFYLYVDVRSFLAKSKNFANKSSMELCDKLLEEHLVAVTPGDAFGTPGFIRLTYALAEKNIVTGMNRIKAAFEAEL